MAANLKHTQRFKAMSGFSLVELMIVVAIIGILSALAVPKFQSFQAKAKQSEAKSNLSHVYTLEQSYYGDQDSFANLATIGFSIQGKTTTGGACAGATAVAGARYCYDVTTTTNTFNATATAKNNTVISSDCGFTDFWYILQDKKLVLLRDCVSKNQTANRQY